MGMPDHPIYLLRSMYADQEATARTRHDMMDWCQIGKGVCQGCIFSLCLFNIYSECIMQNTWLDEAQAGDKIEGRNIITSDMQMTRHLWQKLKPLVKEKEKVGLKLNIQKTKTMASGLITSWQIDGETMETVTDFVFLGSKITVDCNCSHEIKRCLLLGRKTMANLF